jgi:hypothetical protein
MIFKICLLLSIAHMFTLDIYSCVLNARWLVNSGVAFGNTTVCQRAAVYYDSPRGHSRRTPVFVCATTAGALDTLAGECCFNKLHLSGACGAAELLHIEVNRSSLAR